MIQVSVVIPAFNSEPFIGAAIRSVQEQTLHPREIIVVDDGSTDGTENIVRRCAGPVPVFYHHLETQGAGGARNAGVLHAESDWIAFLDADDIWHPHKLSTQVEQIHTCPDGVFFYSDFDVLRPDGSVAPRPAVRQFNHSKSGDWKKLAAIVFGPNPFPFPSTALLKKSVFVELGGFRSDMRGKYYEDFEFFSRLVQKYPFYFSAHDLVRYRLNPKSQKELHCTPNIVILLGSLWQLWRDQPEKQAILVKHYAYHYAMQAKYVLQDGDYLQAREYYHTSFRYCPGLYYPWHWKNLRRWASCYMPGLRQLCSRGAMKRMAIE